MTDTRKVQLAAEMDASGVRPGADQVEKTVRDMAQTISADIGRANRRYAGVFQVSVVMPLGDGPVPAEVIVASLAALFPPATPIVQSGLTVWIKDPLSPSPAITERDRYQIPCSLSYLADTY